MIMYLHRRHDFNSHVNSETMCHHQIVHKTLQNNTYSAIFKHKKLNNGTTILFHKCVGTYIFALIFLKSIK